MYQRETVIYWGDADQVLVAEAPELPGCMAHGDLHAGALANVLLGAALMLKSAVVICWR